MKKFNFSCSEGGGPCSEGGGGVWGPCVVWCREEGVMLQKGTIYLVGKDK